jgi:UDP-N-acetylmuramoyl-tripeptide--D-alanyl-D-alanine ligase
MKQFFAGEIKNLVNGSIIQGTEDLLIKHAASYLKKMKQPHTLLFLLRKWEIDFDKLKKCVPCAIVTDQVFEELKSIDGCTIIYVKDIRIAYWRFVEYYRGLFQIPVVAVTGTCGKSTTKEMIKHILRAKYEVHGTVASANGRPGHFNNLIGIDEKTEAAVFETAVGRPGDITFACRYFKPSIGIITNIGATHLDGCMTEQGYIQAKNEMVTELGSKGILSINADDENCRKIDLEQFKGRIVYFGIHSPSHFQASDLQYGDSGMDFVLTFRNIKYPLFVPGYGEHQVYNALAALAAVHEMGMGIGIKEAAEALRTYSALSAHLQLERGIGGCLILNDTWNSNPTSLRAAFWTLNGIAQGRERVALIGNMRHLGNSVIKGHRQAGDMVAEIGVDILVTVGAMAKLIGKQAEEKGLKGEIRTFATIRGVREFLESILNSNTILLVKCSSKDKPIKDLLNSLKQ